MRGDEEARQIHAEHRRDHGEPFTTVHDWDALTDQARQTYRKIARKRPRP